MKSKNLTASPSLLKRCKTIAGSQRPILLEMRVHPEGPYCLNLDIQIEGDGRGLWLTSGIPEVEWISGGIAPSLKYRVTRNQKSEVEKIDLPKDVGDRQFCLSRLDLQFQWISWNDFRSP